MNKQLKNTIAALTAELLTLTAIPLPTSAVNVPKKADSWDGTADTSWYDSEADSFSIDTAEALAGLAELVNAGDPMTGKSFYLERDLLLNDIGNYENWDMEPPANSWKSIGTDKNAPFDGIFYGQGNTICGMYQKSAQMNDHDFPIFCGGVFGTISENAEISGIDCRYAYVYLENEQIVPEESIYWEISTPYAGGICGLSQGGSITDCHFDGEVTALAASGGIYSNSAFAGGICARSNADSSITNCSNRGSIFASYAAETHDFIRVFCYAGGICGYAEDSSVNGCCNFGELSVKAYYDGFAGGICGEMWHCVNIENTYNTGNISASTLSEGTASLTNALSNFAFSGGIAGDCFARNEEQQGSIHNCYNTGNLSSNGPIENAISGGILGGTDAQYMDYTAKIVNCYYLDTTSDRCFGMGDADDFAQTDAEMREELFAGLLWEAFYCQPNHYPILTWEADKTPDTGDVNGDGLFSLSDVVMMQKFILGSEYLTVPQAGDVCMDLRLDGFDLAVMKRLLILAE